MTTVLQQETLVDRISKLTVIDQIVETIWVDDPIGQIEINKTIKDGDIVKNISETVNYKLKSHRLIVKKNNKKHNQVVISDLPKSQTLCNNRETYQCLSSDINRIFISELKSFKSTQKYSYKYFSQNFFSKLIFPKKESDLINQILDKSSDCSWVIMPTFIFDIIKNSTWFEPNNIHSDSIIHNVGKLDELNVYVNPEEIESRLYFGNYDSISIIINKNIKEDSIKSSILYTEGKTIVVDYLFLENGVTKYMDII